MSELFFDSDLDQRFLNSGLIVIRGSPSEGFEEAFRFVNPDRESSESLREQLSLQFEVAINMPGLTGIEKYCLAIKAIEMNNEISKTCDDSTKVDDHNDILGRIITLTNADLDNLLRVTAVCLDSVCLLPISREDSDEIVGDTIVQNLSKIEKFKSIIFKKDEANPGFVSTVLTFLKAQKDCEYTLVKNESLVDTLVISIGMEADLFSTLARQEKSNGRFGVVEGR